MTHGLSEIANWRKCNANIPAGYAVGAVVEAVTEGWDRDMVEATAAKGVSPLDREAIEECIREHDLDCTAAECEARLLDWARAEVAA